MNLSLNHCVRCAASPNSKAKGKDTCKCKCHTPPLKREFEQDTAVDLGLLILEMRIKSNLTQKALAKKMDVSQPCIARAERGGCEPKMSFLLRVAKAAKLELIMPIINESKTHTQYE